MYDEFRKAEAISEVETISAPSWDTPGDTVRPLQLFTPGSHPLLRDDPQATLHFSTRGLAEALEHAETALQRLTYLMLDFNAEHPDGMRAVRGASRRS